MLCPVTAALLQVNPLDADDWGSIRGQIVVEDEISERPLLITKGADVKDNEVCEAEDYYSEDLSIDKESKGLANVFVYLVKKPKSIHADLIGPTTEAVPVTTEGLSIGPAWLVCRTDQCREIGSDDGIARRPHIRPQKKSGTWLARSARLVVQTRGATQKGRSPAVQCQLRRSRLYPRRLAHRCPSLRGTHEQRRGAPSTNCLSANTSTRSGTNESAMWRANTKSPSRRVSP